MMEDESEIREKMVAIIRDKAKQIYSDKVVEYGTNPGNYGRIDLPDGYARKDVECGENIEMFLRVKDGKVEESRFISDGCMFTIAACNAATEMARGKMIQECLRINLSSIMEHLSGVPMDHAHCALDAALIFQKALRNYIINNK
jgi:nitrogen fixation protein NifU and related proteins